MANAEHLTESGPKIILIVPGSPENSEAWKRVTDTGSETVATRIHLKLVQTAIADEGLVSLGNLMAIESLNLNSTQISDTGLAHLSKLESLSSIYLWRTSVSKEGAASLEDSLRNDTAIRRIENNIQKLKVKLEKE